MPRVSIRRLLLYAAYTLAGASLVMLANIALQQQSSLWLRVIEQQQQQQALPVNVAREAGDGQSKEKDDEYHVDMSPPSAHNEEAPLSNASAISTLRRHGLPWYIKNDGYRPPAGLAVGNIWPGRLKTDRIEEQLMIAPRLRAVEDDRGLGADNQVGGEVADSVKSEPLKRIFLPSGLASWQVKGGRSLFLEQKCPVDRCYLTGKREDAATADAILFKDFFSAPSHKRSPHQIWIMYMLECPLHTQFVREKDVFNWTATYRTDSELVAPYEKWVYYDPQVRRKPVTTNYAANKTNKVAWFVSNCGAKNNRLEYAHALQNFIQVDIYGSCGSKSCPRHSGNRCLEVLAKEYKFYLAFENSNCRDYITEKFYVNGLGSKVLPIVMGAPKSDYERLAPEHSFIHVDDFQSPKELAAYLDLLDRNDTLYNEYFEWRETGQFINTYFFCRLCAMVHEAPSAPPRRYGDFNEWWRGGNDTPKCIRTSWREHEESQIKRKLMQAKKKNLSSRLLPPKAT